MPNIVYLWNFEDGTTQGWALGPYSSLDGTGKIQGTYSIKYRRSLPAGSVTLDDLWAYISGVSLINVSKPLLVFVIRDTSSDTYVNNPYDIGVVVKDGTGNVLLNSTTRIAKLATGFFRVVMVDLSPVANQSDLTIELKRRGLSNIQGTAEHYVDMIAILDGADYEYNTGVVAFGYEDKIIDIAVPDPDISGLNIDRFALCLATPDWKYTHMEATAITNTASLKITTYDATTMHVNYAVPSTPPVAFQGLRFRVFTSITAYDGFIEKIGVVFLDSSWSYKRVYLFNAYITLNGFSDRFACAVSTTTYGSGVSGSRAITGKVYGNNFDVALKVKYLVGDPSVVVSGFVKLEIYSSDMSIKYGEVTIDITLGSEQTSTYITGLPTGVDLRLIVSYSITANARVVLLIVPLVKVY